MRIDGLCSERLIVFMKDYAVLILRLGCILEKCVKKTTHNQKHYEWSMFYNLNWLTISDSESDTPF